MKQSLKTKIILYKKRAGKRLSFSSKNRGGSLDQAEIDKRLVYNLAPRKIPSGKQFKYLKNFLNPKENLAIKICSLVAVAAAVFLGASFFHKHLQYLPKSGGEYVEGVVGYPKTVNPLYDSNRDVDSDLSSLIYSSLFRYDKDGNLVPDLAEKVDIEGDQIYTIKIKGGVRWSDGSVLTADDVIFTINTIQNEDYRSSRRTALAGVTAEKIDNQTIKLTLSTPYAPFLDSLTFGILPKTIWQDISPSSASLSELNLKPVGSGPYKFKSFVKNKDGDMKEYNLVVNDGYYGAKPFITKIKFEFFPSYEEAIAALNDNKIDGLGYLPFENRKDLIAKDSLSWHELVRPQIVALFFNDSHDKALADKDVRTSLAEAIDKDQLIKEVFDGAYLRADGPIMSTSFAYDKSLKTYPYSPSEAAAAVKGHLASTTITVVDSGNNVAVATKIKAYWEAIGVGVDLKVIPGEQAADVVKNRDFEIILYGESVGGDPDIYAFWHSSQAGPKGLNIASYSDSGVDKLLVAARTTTDNSARQEDYRRIQEKINADIPAIFLYSPTYTYVQSKNVKGFAGTAAIEPSGRFSGISDWYLKTSKKLAW